MNQRIRELRKLTGLTQEEFAARLGIKRGSLANYEVGRNEPLDAVISLICREFHVNEAWLRFGQGEMFCPQDADESLSRFFGQVAGEENSFRKQLLSGLAQLDAQDWAALETVFRKLQS